MPEVELGPKLDRTDKVRFVDAHRPALPDGDYTVTLNHRLEDHEFSAKQELNFVVTGPRFALPNTEIASTFPPKNASGAFEAVLPHVILERASLPWERTALPHASGVDPEDRLPWLALLVFTDDEIDKRTKILPANDLLGGARHAGWTALPNETADDPEQQVLVLDLPSRLAQSVMPTAAELSLLTSVRVVNGDESKAVIVGNRLCKPGARHIAHLVSLEGQYRKKGAPTGNVAHDFEHWAHGSSHSVRLISLAQWTFHCSESVGDFHQILSNVTPSQLALPDKDLGAAQNAVSAGAIPLRHLRDTGDMTASWYHGPLAIAHHDVDLGLPARHAWDLLKTDSETGLVDISYAAAWQLGRLLALKDPKVGPVLYQWKRRVQHAARIDTVKDDNPGVELSAPEVPEFPLTQWFENALGKLASVPFDYLVPDPSILEPETIAFFTLDKAWMRALADGAFSIGRTGQKQQVLDALHRARIPDSAQSVPTRSGFLLRSRAVDGWPDLIVDGLDESGKELGAPIRFERLGNGVLLVLFEGKIADAVIHLHPQAMHFGFDGTRASGLTKPRANGSGSPVGLKLRHNSRTLDILDRLGSGLAADIGATTAHSFALAMIEAVPRIRFHTELPDV
ncbi:hypothetical protein [Thalassococcus lentus]|uniref:Uncharacterized protein n=1 Tax=Thalassococcus lentus TaxID=1210524 RepID=A0ABT4XP58_9RHOB|nr:hypothetical protein [Thalassococcus lentus]MDA7423692.1 hypothetical protein [Thalassococcus lentus]